MPITSLFQNWDNGGVPVQQFGLITRISFVRWSSFFALMSAYAHFAVLRDWASYEKDLKKGINRFRWYEYSLSSSLIITLLFMVWGNFDFVQLSGCFVINWCTIMFGLEHEKMNSNKLPKDVDWSCFYYGALCGAVAWCILWGNALTDPDRGDYPWFAWAYLIGYQILFFTFPWNLWNQYR